MRDLRIGELAERAGASAPTIRYYEEIGLLPPPSRRAGGRRSYGTADVERLLFIRRCRALGFSLKQIRGLAGVAGDDTRSCAEARDLARRHLADLRARLRALQALEQAVDGFVSRCEAVCATGTGRSCVALADLRRPEPARGA